MSFSKGIPAGKKLDEEKGEFDGYRGDNAICECAYPNCRSRRIGRDEHAVFWDGVHLNKDAFERNLSPIAKLAAIANPTDYFEKYNQYHVTIGMHAECAAEWGMHLIKDAMGDYSIGNKLRGTRNAIREQT